MTAALALALGALGALYLARIALVRAELARRGRPLDRVLAHLPRTRRASVVARDLALGALLLALALRNGAPDTATVGLALAVATALALGNGAALLADARDTAALVSAPADRDAAERAAALRRFHLDSLAALPGIILFAAEAERPGQPLDEVPYTLSRGGLLPEIGLEQGEWEGTPFLPTVPAPHRPGVAAVLRGDAASYTYATPYPDVRGGTLHMAVVAVHYEDGQLVGHVRDVTAEADARAEADRLRERHDAYRDLFDDDLDALIQRARA